MMSGIHTIEVSRNTKNMLNAQGSQSFPQVNTHRYFWCRHAAGICVKVWRWEGERGVAWRGNRDKTQYHQHFRWLFKKIECRIDMFFFSLRKEWAVNEVDFLTNRNSKLKGVKWRPCQTVPRLPCDSPDSTRHGLFKSDCFFADYL